MHATAPPSRQMLGYAPKIHLNGKIFPNERSDRCQAPFAACSSRQQEKALTYQFGGQSKSGLPREGQWRCLWLAKISDAQLRDGAWRTGSSHSQPQGCVEIVDLDVNPHSPYRPKRPLS